MDLTCPNHTGERDLVDLSRLIVSEVSLWAINQSIHTVPHYHGRILDRLCVFCNSEVEYQYNREGMESIRGSLTYFPSSGKVIIQVKPNEKILSKKFILAHELFHYLLQVNKGRYNHSTYIDNHYVSGYLTKFLLYISEEYLCNSLVIKALYNGRTIPIATWYDSLLDDMTLEDIDELIFEHVCQEVNLGTIDTEEGFNVIKCPLNGFCNPSNHVLVDGLIAILKKKVEANCQLRNRRQLLLMED